MLSPSLASARRIDWLQLIAAFALLAFLLMVWRWGGIVADSQAYYDTARYLRGEIPASSLVAPFPYRLLVPAVASIIPGDLRNGFAMLNWALVTAAACLMSAAVLRAGLGPRRAIAAGLLMIVSLPTFWYAPYLLVDPGSVCARAAFVLALLSGQPWLAALAGLAGTAIREENILLLVWLVAMRRIAILPGLAVLAAAGGMDSRRALVARHRLAGVYLGAELGAGAARPAGSALAGHHRGQRLRGGAPGAAGLARRAAGAASLRGPAPADGAAAAVCRAVRARRRPRRVGPVSLPGAVRRLCWPGSWHATLTNPLQGLYWPLYNSY
jgi:hypothetical protein